MADGYGYSVRTFDDEEAPNDPSNDPNYIASLMSDPDDTGGGKRRPPPRKRKKDGDGEGEQPIDLTEDQVALVFAHKFTGQLLFCHTARSWYRWTGAIWAKEETRLAYTWARELCRKAASDAENVKVRATFGKAGTAAGVERFAQADRAFAVTVAVWDVDPWLLGTPGGTVDLRQGLLRPADPSDRITKSAVVAPSVELHCPQWLAFLDETTGHDAELIRFLRQWCGYCLTGDTREHALLFGYGPGGNGKSVFINTVAHIMADYALTAGMETFAASRNERHSTELARLRGARMVTASETEEGQAWAESRVKQVTGGDPITARFMRQDDFTYLPHFKLTVVGNNKPVLRTVDDAMKRRFRMVPFLNKPKKPDKELEAKLRLEAPGILRWMIEGCLDWQRNGLIRPQVIDEATKEYFEDQDSYAQWVEECCDIGWDCADTNGSLWSSWANHAKRTGADMGSNKGLTQWLERAGYGRIKDERGIRGRGMKGLRVRVHKASHDEGDQE